MTFEERCKRFEKKSEKETNIFKYIYRVIFLEREKEKQKQLTDSILNVFTGNEK